MYYTLWLYYILGLSLIYNYLIDGIKITYTKDKVIVTKITRNIYNYDPIMGSVVKKNYLSYVLQNN